MPSVEERLEALERKPKKVSRWLVSELVSEEPPTSGDAYVWNDTNKMWRPQPATTVVVKASDETLNNNDVRQDDNELLFSIGASETWTFDMVLFVVAANATPDISVAVTVPASATLNAVILGPATGATGFPYAVTSPSVLTAGGSASLGVISTTRQGIVIHGAVVNSTTAGAVTLQWAQNLATAVNTTVKAGSFLRAWKV